MTEPKNLSEIPEAKEAKRQITVKNVSLKNMGIQAIDGKWFNMEQSIPEVDVEELKKVVTQINRGDFIELTGNVNAVIPNFNDIKIVTKAVAGSGKSKSGNFSDDMMHYDDYLIKAHNEFGLDKIETERIDILLDMKYALFKATVTDKDGKTFQAHGDVTAENINTDKVKAHWIRMAETRAVCRALKMMCTTGNKQGESYDKKE